MNFKISLLVFVFFVTFWFAAPVDAAAQTKQRVVLSKKGFARVTGTIHGSEIRQYVFRVRKDADIDISIDNDDHAAPVVRPYPKFLIYKPNGKPLYDDQEPAEDLLDVLPAAGDYTLRLQLPEDMRNNGKPVKFSFYIRVRY